jgi:THO complex subunit 2
MENIRKKWLLTVSSRSGPSNALSNSVLLDDDSPATSSAAAEASGLPPKPPPEQQIQLLHALLSLGDLPAAEYLLARFPWVAQSHPAISDLIMQIVAGALENVYRTFATQSLQGSEEGEVDLLAPAPTLRLTNKEVVATLYNPPPPETPTKRFEFFYPHWQEGMELWETPEDIRVKGLRWLQLTRGLAARSVEVMVKICRLGAAHFAALRKEKEVGLGLTHGAKTKDELRSVEVSDPVSDPRDCRPNRRSLLWTKWSRGWTSFAFPCSPHFPLPTPRRRSTSSSGRCCDTSLIPCDIACTVNGATRPADLVHAVLTRPRLMLRPNALARSKRLCRG